MTTPTFYNESCAQGTLATFFVVIRHVLKTSYWNLPPFHIAYGRYGRSDVRYEYPIKYVTLDALRLLKGEQLISPSVYFWWRKCSSPFFWFLNMPGSGDKSRASVPFNAASSYLVFEVDGQLALPLNLCMIHCMQSSCLLFIIIIIIM